VGQTEPLLRPGWTLLLLQLLREHLRGVERVPYLQETFHLVLNFPYVCPEPVLVKRWHFQYVAYKMASQKRRFFYEIGQACRRATECCALQRPKDKRPATSLLLRRSTSQHSTGQQHSTRTSHHTHSTAHAQHTHSTAQHSTAHAQGSRLESDQIEPARLPW
jgi:hypothetical protein